MSTKGGKTTLKASINTPKRRKNSNSGSGFFQSSRDLIDSQLFAFLSDTDKEEKLYHGIVGDLEEGDDNDDDDDDDDDDDGNLVIGAVVGRENDDNAIADSGSELDDDDDDDGDDEFDIDADEDDDDEFDQNTEQSLRKLTERADDDDDEYNDKRIEEEEEVAIVEEMAFQDRQRSTNSDSDSNITDSEAELSFTNALFVDTEDKELNHVYSSTTPFEFHESDDDSFILDYLFSSGNSSDEEQSGKMDHSGRIKKRRRRDRKRAADYSQSEKFDLIRDREYSSGLDATIRKQERGIPVYEFDDGESTDEDENLPPPSHRKAGHRATEILVSSITASKPPVLGSWVLPVDRRVGIINGLSTRTLSPPPFPRGSINESNGRSNGASRQVSSSRHSSIIDSSPSMLASMFRSNLAHNPSHLISSEVLENENDREHNVLALEDFIYLSELDEDDNEDNEHGPHADHKFSGVSSSDPSSTPVWVGKFHSKFPLSAFRNRSSMQYRGI
ncbi:transcription factor CRF1-domain-containing protein [Dipodascopsis uninucleata]